MDALPAFSGGMGGGKNEAPVETGAGCPYPYESQLLLRSR